MVKKTRVPSGAPVTVWANGVLFYVVFGGHYVLTGHDELRAAKEPYVKELLERCTDTECPEDDHVNPGDLPLRSVPKFARDMCHEPLGIVAWNRRARKNIPGGKDSSHLGN